MRLDPIGIVVDTSGRMSIKEPHFVEIRYVFREYNNAGEQKGPWKASIRRSNGYCATINLDRVLPLSLCNSRKLVEYVRQAFNNEIEVYKRSVEDAKLYRPYYLKDLKPFQTRYWRRTSHIYNYYLLFYRDNFTVAPLTDDIHIACLEIANVVKKKFKVSVKNKPTKDFVWTGIYLNKKPSKAQVKASAEEELQTYINNVYNDRSYSREMTRALIKLTSMYTIEVNATKQLPKSNRT